MRKNLLTLFVALGLSAAAFSQTATDFTCNDCDGVAHNLFSELNSGKVIVLTWVMPCGACTGPSLTTYNVVQSYSGSHPNTVIMYVVDDYANTTCQSLNSWKNSIGLGSLTSFSNAAIDMMDYGSTGMPKIVVLGGGTHTVFYNANNVVNSAALQSAINAALAIAGVNEQDQFASSLSVSPNPASGKSMIKFYLAENSPVSIELFNLEGKRVQKVFSGDLSKGANQAELNTKDLAAGTYLVKVSSRSKSNYINLVVAR